MRPLLAVLSLSSSLILLAPSPSLAGPTHHKTTAPTAKKAILKVLNDDFKRTTKDHAKISPFTITSMDIRSGWALVGVESRKRDLDPFTTLLQQKRGRWTILTLGTNLHGSGKQYDVPHSLWRPWGLDGG